MRDLIRSVAPLLLLGVTRRVSPKLLLALAAVSPALAAVAAALARRVRPSVADTEGRVVARAVRSEQREGRPWTHTTLFRLLMLLVTLSTAIGIVGAAVLIAPRKAVVSVLSDDEPAVIVPGGKPEEGKVALTTYGCIACHTVPGIRGLETTVGPPLDRWAEREYIAGSLPNTPENLIAWIQNPQAIEPGTVMPTLGVSDAHARDIAAYLYTLDEPPPRRWLPGIGSWVSGPAAPAQWHRWVAEEMGAP